MLSIQERQDLLDWFCQPAQISLMQKASDRDRPAVEPIDAAFAVTFPHIANQTDKQTFDADKREIGKIVKQAMGTIGYEVTEPRSRTQISCRGTHVFTSGSRYRQQT